MDILLPFTVDSLSLDTEHTFILEHPHSRHFKSKILTEIKVFGALFLFLKVLGLHRISRKKELSVFMS